MASKIYKPYLYNHRRDASVSQSILKEICDNCGLKCIGQEMVNWRTRPRFLIDCFTLATLEGSRFERENKIIKNRRFMTEARIISDMFRNYGSLPPGSTARQTSGQTAA